MYLFYVDESGNTGADLAAPDQPVHWLIALAVRPPELRSVEHAMLALALRFFGSAAIAPDFELKGNEIFGGRGRCRALSAGDRVELFAALLALLVAHDVHVFVCGVDKAALDASRSAERHPAKLAFRHLADRIDRWLEERQPPADLLGGASEPVYGLLVADEQDEVGRANVASLAFWRSTPDSDPEGGRHVKYLIDTVHHVPSQDSWLIQLTDCVAFIRGRFERVWRAKGGDVGAYSESDRAVARLWEACAACVACEHSCP